MWFAFASLETSDRQRGFARSRAYTALMAGFAALAVTIVAVGTPRSGYLAESVLKCDASNGASIEQIESWLTSPEVLRTALKNLTTKPSLTSLAAGNWPDVTCLRQRTRVINLAAYDEAPRFVIEFTGRSGKAAQAGATELAALFEADFEAHRRAVNTLALEAQGRKLSQRLARLRGEEDQQHLQIERLRHEELARTMLAVQRDGQASRQVPPTTPAPTTQWSQLTNQLDGLMLKRTELLAKFLPAHPQIEQLNLQIAKLSDQLRQTPKFDGFENPPSVPQSDLELPPPSERSARRDLPLAARNMLQVTQQQYVEPSPTDAENTSPNSVDSALSHLAHIAKSRQDLELQLDAIRQQLSSPAVAGAWTSTPSRIVAKLGGHPAPWQMGVALVIGLIAMGGAIFASHVDPRSRILWSPDQAEKTLALPILAQLPPVETSGQAPTSGLQPYPLRAFALSAELILGVILLACLLASVQDFSLAHEFLSDPLGAMNESVGRLLGSM